jgi:hypothetical protein
MVVKVCNGSCKENAVEWIIYSALAAIDAEELVSFASFECSRTGKYVLTDKLGDLVPPSCDIPPVIPRWLPNARIALGINENATVKIRRWADVKLSELLMRATVRRTS